MSIVKPDPAETDEAVLDAQWLADYRRAPTENERPTRLDIVRMARVLLELDREVRHIRLMACEECGTHYEGKRVDGLYCGRACRSKVDNRRRREEYRKKKAADDAYVADHQRTLEVVP